MLPQTARITGIQKENKMMQYFVGFLVGVVVCAVVAHTYIQSVVNKEITDLRASLVVFKTKLEAKVAEIKSKL